MTLGIAWVRVVGGTRELVVSSDSRLSGGQSWDGNPKIILLPRSDAVISFAGSTNDAYPLMIQAVNAINMYPPAQDRTMDIADLKGHLVRVFNHSRESISNLPNGYNQPEDPGAIFMLSGYSWRTKRFHIWKLHFDPEIRRYTFRPTSVWSGQEAEAYKLIAYVGDDEAVADAKRRLVELLRERGKLQTGSLDMEPLEVLRDVIRESKFRSVGGPIQLVKIYEHANVVPVGIFWPTRESGTICVLGRSLMDYERTRWGVIDPDMPDRAQPLDRLEGQ
jgi:hypothetical protein